MKIVFALILAFPLIAYAQSGPNAYVGGMSSTDGSTWSPLSSSATTGPLSPNIYGGLLGYNSSTGQWYPCSTANPCTGGGGSASLTFSIKYFGAIGDGNHPAQDTAALNAAITAMCSAGGWLYFPAGTYDLTNSGGAFTFTSCNGLRITGDDAATTLIFSTLANDGMDFNTNTGLAIEHLAMKFAGSTTTRQSATGYPFNINGGSNISLSHLYLSNGNISSMRVGNATHVRIEAITLNGFLANGVYTVNNQDEQVHNVSCASGGDACVEYDWLDSATSNAQRAIIDGVNSYNDVSCVLLDGTSQVTVSNFNCVGNAHEAILIEQDSSTGNTAQYPDEVTITNGNIVDAGYGTNPNNTPGAYGMYFYIQNTPTSKQRISVSNVHILHVGGNGLFLADNNTIDLKMNNVLFDTVGANGATGSNGRTQACINVDGDRVELNAVTAANCAGPALYPNYTNQFVANGFTSINPNSTALTTNAIYYPSGNTYNTLNMAGTTLVDTQATNVSGITIAATAGTQMIQGIASQFSHTWPGVTSSNSTASVYLASTHLPVSGGIPTPQAAVSACMGNTNTPTVTTGGTDSSFQLNFTTGASPGTSCVLFQTTYANSFPVVPLCSLTPGNAATALAITDLYSAGSTGQFNLSVGATALTASTAYKVIVKCQ